MSVRSTIEIQYGLLAATCGKRLPLEVLKSPAGFYIGTLDDDGSPFSRESVEYWKARPAAVKAMVSGEWTQKPQP